MLRSFQECDGTPGLPNLTVACYKHGYRTVTSGNADYKKDICVVAVLVVVPEIDLNLVRFSTKIVGRARVARYSASGYYEQFEESPQSFKPQLAPITRPAEGVPLVGISAPCGLSMIDGPISQGTIRVRRICTTGGHVSGLDLQR